MSPPLVPSLDIRRRSLWREFLAQPGTLETLLGHLETVRGIGGEEKQEQKIDDEELGDTGFKVEMYEDHLQDEYKMEEDGQTEGMVKTEGENTSSDNRVKNREFKEIENKIKNNNEIMDTVDKSEIKETEHTVLVMKHKNTEHNYLTPSRREMDVLGYEDEFHPLSSSSCVTSSPLLTPLPPMSPRTMSPTCPQELQASPRMFFMDRNIDQVPERNVTSPRTVQEDLVSIKVPVIKQTPTKVNVDLSVDLCVKTFPTKTEALSPRVSTPLLTPRSSPIPSIILPFYPPLLPVPVLPNSLVCEIQRFFSLQPSGHVTRLTCSSLALILGLPSSLRLPLFFTVFGSEAQSGSCSQFLSFWQTRARLLNSPCLTQTVFHLLTNCSDTLTPSMLDPLVRDVLSSHPQLDFFAGRGDCQELQDFYVEAVVASIVFQAGGWRGRRITYRQFLKLNFVETLEKVDQLSEHELNLVEHFSYDQFYVLYHKFVSRDSLGRGSLVKQDLLDISEDFSLGMFTRKVVDRVFLRNITSTHMGFVDWVYFVLAEVDKGSSSGMDYWFSVLDTDEDGLLSLTELESFYSASLVLLVTADMAVPQLVGWEDLGTQILDTTMSHISTLDPGHFSLMDLKKNSKFPHILNVFVNILKFIVDDENEIVDKSDLSPIQMFVMKSMLEMENE